MDSLLRKDPAIGVMRARANSRPCRRKTISGADSTLISAGWNEGANASDRSGKAFAGSLDIDGATDTSDDVSAIGDIEGFHRFGALIQLIDLPLSCLLVQIRRTLANDLRASRRQEQLQSFDLGTSGEGWRW